MIISGSESIRTRRHRSEQSDEKLGNRKTSDQALNKLYQSINTCASCGFCRSSCPVYCELGWESYAPIGKLAIARLTQSLGWQADQAERVFRCTLCGNCQVRCPLRIDLRETWIGLRVELGHHGQVPNALHRLREAVKSSRNVTGEANENRILWSDDLGDTPSPFLKPNSDIVYFVGCVAGLYPTVYDVPRSFARLLDKLGLNYSMMGGEEWCCGFPLIGAGIEEEIPELARHNVDKIRELGASTVVTTCPSCYHVWKHVYPRLLANYDFQVLHSVELLSRLDVGARLAPPARSIDGSSTLDSLKSDVSVHTSLAVIERCVTYHDPCDLGRLSGLYEAPRQIIRSLPGTKFVEMKHYGEDSLCCGGGGDLEMVDPQLAAAIARRRLREAVDTGAEAIVTACQQCKRTLLGAARKSKVRMKVLDIGELVWEALSTEGD